MPAIRSLQREIWAARMKRDTSQTVIMPFADLESKLNRQERERRLKARPDLARKLPPWVWRKIREREKKKKGETPPVEPAIEEEDLPLFSRSNACENADYRKEHPRCTQFEPA